MLKPNIKPARREEYCHIGRVNLCSVLSGHGGSSDFGAGGTRGVRGRSGGLKTVDEVVGTIIRIRCFLGWWRVRRWFRSYVPAAGLAYRRVLR